MIVLQIALFIIWFLFFMVTLINSHEKNDYTGFVAYMFCTVIIIVSAISCKENKPTALDVYRGNTKIEKVITIKDNDTIKIDSIIVFK